MSEHLRKRGRVWYATVYVERIDAAGVGHLVADEKSTGCPDTAAARARLR